jgi:hypothetical protein
MKPPLPRARRFLRGALRRKQRRDERDEDHERREHEHQDATDGDEWVLHGLAPMRSRARGLRVP